MIPFPMQMMKVRAGRARWLRGERVAPDLAQLWADRRNGEWLGQWVNFV
jgi:hypothetical protein